MKKTIIIAIVAALGLFFGVAVALSYGPGFGPFGPGVAFRQGFGPGFGPPAFAGGFGPWGSDSGLTPEQSAKIQTLQQEALKEITPLQQELFQKTAALRDLMWNQNPDEGKISALQQEIQDIRAKLLEKATQVRIEVQEVAPELQARFGTSGPGPGFGPGPGSAPGRARMLRPW